MVTLQLQKLSGGGGVKLRGKFQQIEKCFFALVEENYQTFLIYGANGEFMVKIEVLITHT